MFFQQIYEKGLAHASYMVGCQKTGTVAVIDAQRDVDVYINIARKEKLTITHILETHIHADFLCGSRELAELTGATIYASDEGGSEWQYTFPHAGLHDNDSFMVGNIKFDVWHTPGHTPEHISFLVTDTPATDKPIMFFSGDFVFVGDVGRPDLLEKAAGIKGTMVKGAHQMYHSLERFKTLPDYVQVHPAHGAGSACGKALGAIPSTTVGYEKVANWALQFTDEEAFVSALLEGQPEPPKYFAMMKMLNKEYRTLITQVPTLHKYSVDDVKNAMQANTVIVDTRGKLAFAGGHLPGALNIQNNNSFTTWAGWMLDYQTPFLLVAGDEHIETVTRKLMRIGLDNIAGYTNGIEEWSSEGHEPSILPEITVHQLHERIQNGTIHVLDVRGIAEYNEGHIAGAQHIHAGYLANRLDEIPRTTDVAVHCAGGDRSSTACSLLQRAGFTNVINVVGGFNAWRESNLPTETETVAEQMA